MGFVKQVVRGLFSQSIVKRIRNFNEAIPLSFLVTTRSVDFEAWLFSNISFLIGSITFRSNWYHSDGLLMTSSKNSFLIANRLAHPCFCTGTTTHSAVVFQQNE